MSKFIVSSLLVGLAFGIIMTVLFGVFYKSQDLYGIVVSEVPYPLHTVSRTIKIGSIYGLPLAWNKVRPYEPVTFLFEELDVACLLLDIAVWGVIGGFPLALWVVNKEDIAWKGKLLRSVLLTVSVPLLAFSPQYIFHMERVPRTYPISLIPSPSSEYVWAFNIYCILFGVFLLTTGIVLVVASYYHNSGSELMRVANEEKMAKID